MRRWIPVSIVTVILCLLVAVPIATFIAAAAFAQAEREQAVRAVERARRAEIEARERAELQRRRVEDELRRATLAKELVPETHRLEHQIAKMEAEIEELREQGRDEEAETLQREARQVRNRLGELRDLARKLEEGRHAEVHLEHEHGEHEHAEHGEAFHEHAHKELEHAHPHGPDPRAMDRVRHLHEAAEHLHAAGYEEQARDLHAEAERLERQLHGGVPPEHLEHLQRQLDELREQNARLTEQVNRMVGVLEKLQERLEERQR